MEFLKAEELCKHPNLSNADLRRMLDEGEDALGEVKDWGTKRTILLLLVAIQDEILRRTAEVLEEMPGERKLWAA